MLLWSKQVKKPDWFIEVQIHPPAVAGKGCGHSKEEGTGMGTTEADPVLEFSGQDAC